MFGPHLQQGQKFQKVNAFRKRHEQVTGLVTKYPWVFLLLGILLPYEKNVLKLPGEIAKPPHSQALGKMPLFPWKKKPILSPSGEGRRLARIHSCEEVVEKHLPLPLLLGEGHRTTMIAGSWASKQKPAAPTEDEAMLLSLRPNTILSRVWQLQGRGAGMTRYCLSRTNSKGKLEIQRKRNPSISTVVLAREQ